jgi:hypothetical protein
MAFLEDQFLIPPLRTTRAFQFDDRHLNIVTNAVVFALLEGHGMYIGDRHAKVREESEFHWRDLSCSFHDLCWDLINLLNIEAEFVSNGFNRDRRSGRQFY